MVNKQIDTEYEFTKKKKKSIPIFIIKTLLISLGTAFLIAIILGILSVFILQDSYAERNNYGAPFMATAALMISSFWLTFIGSIVIRIIRFTRNN